ncbi:MAG: S1 RNA-binding domain-containing protein, partial [Candidatus Omnitrophica bacterium]|nr:S1 RNA-binding domain-containing protein [Candidatus Omnitrophota bacterium]
MKEIAEGSVLKGRILSKTATELVVDIGYKSEGIIALSEFPDPAALKVGDEIDVYLETKENDEGMVVLSKRKADRVQGWERVIAEHKEGDIIEGRCTRKVKGGYMVDVGIEAFLPASLSSLKGYAKDAQLLGHTLKFIIVKIGRARKNI